eukprot:TRINITY_DN13216_c0_g1_i1.p2 TRINITY_DN13216_c0_g1~~TRINITY_DN13216_c0_g1_i1.p2  ORF type:complete len:143 (-),score=2.19 TRINITY_DN13216_c0_g1_i1:233-661(-)
MYQGSPSENRKILCIHFSRENYDQTFCDTKPDEETAEAPLDCMEVGTQSPKLKKGDEACNYVLTLYRRWTTRIVLEAEALKRNKNQMMEAHFPKNGVQCIVFFPQPTQPLRGRSFLFAPKCRTERRKYTVAYFNSVYTLYEP